MKISFVILIKNELEEIKKLLAQLAPYVKENGDEIIIVSDGPVEHEMYIAIGAWQPVIKKIASRPLLGDFASQRNYADSLCSADSDYIFHLDADEYLRTECLENLREILEANPEVDLFKLPRVNIVRGIVEADVKTWRWTVCGLDEFIDDIKLPMTSDYYSFLVKSGLVISSNDVGHGELQVSYKLPIVNWHPPYCDHQGRLYKNNNRLKWVGAVHEAIQNASIETVVPAMVELSIIHDKSIARQRKQNAFYSEILTK